MEGGVSVSDNHLRPSLRSQLLIQLADRAKVRVAFSIPILPERGPFGNHAFLFCRSYSGKIRNSDDQISRGFLFLRMKANQSPNKNNQQRKNMIQKTVFRALASAVGLMALLLCTTSAIAESSSGDCGGGRLGGVWDSVVTLTNCQGVTLRTLEAHVTFHQGGTLSNFDTNSLNGPGTGTWRNIGGGNYSAPFRFFTFNAAGALTGAVRITRTIHLAKDAMSYTSTVAVTAFDVNGNQVASLCGSEAATRIVD
jgi:hypothetical protein